MAYFSHFICDPHCLNGVCQNFSPHLTYCPCVCHAVQYNLMNRAHRQWVNIRLLYFYACTVPAVLYLNCRYEWNLNPGGISKRFHCHITKKHCVSWGFVKKKSFCNLREFKIHVWSILWISVERWRWQTM